MKKTIFFLLLTVAFSVSLKAQITDVYAGNDTVELRLGNYQYGFIQWQTSQDTVQWENIEGATDTIYRFLPKENAYYRARATFPNCPEVLSRVCYVQVPPKADAGPDRKLMEGDGATMFALLEDGCIGEWEIIEGQGGTLSDIHSPNAYFIGTDEAYKLKWTVTNACGSMSDTVAISYYRTVLNDNIVVIDTTDIICSDSTQLINGIYYVSFSAPEPQINENCILVGVRKNSFLRKVVHYSEDNGIHCFETEEATLDDILLEGVLSFDVRSYLEEQGNKRFVKNRLPTRKELRESKGDCVYIIMPEQEDPLGQQISFNREDGAGTLSWKIGKFKLPGDAYVTPTLTLSPNFVWELDRTWLNVHHFKFGLYNSSILTGKVMEIPGEASFSISDKIIDLPIVPGYPIWLLIAGVPVEFTVNVSASLKQTASYTIGPRMSYTEIQRTTLSSYIEYNENFGWNYDFNLSKTNDFDIELPEYGDFSYELAIGPKFELLVYDVFGPFFSSKLYGKVKGRFGGPHNHATNLTIGLKPEIGARLKFGKYVALEYSYSPNAKFFEADDPFFMEVYSGNNQLYTPGEWLNEEVKVKVYNSRGNLSDNMKVRFETADGTLSSEYVSTGYFDGVFHTGVAKVRWRPSPNATGEITLRAYLYNLKNEPLQCVPVVIRAYQGASVSSCANSTLSVRAELVNGSIRLVANGGKKPYLFSSDGLSFSPTIPLVIPVEGTTYHFYVRDDLNCVRDCYYTHPTLDCFTSGLQLRVQQQGNTVTAIASGGKSPYQYCLDDGTYGSTSVFSYLTNGRHVVYVRDANGCEEAEVFTVEAYGGGTGSGGSSGGSVTVTTSPTVNVLEPTMATGGGSVSITGNATVVRKGICWSRNHAPTTNGDYYTSSSSSNTFSGCPMVNLTPDVIYYMRAFAVTNTGTVYGNEVGFSTTAVAPVVTCGGVGNTTSTSVRALGNVSNVNGTAVTERGFCWSRSHNPTISGSHLACGTGVGAYSGDITGLEPDTPYYLRAYATNSVGTSYSDEISFRTFEGGGGGGDHAYVDLGLPSGLLWAICNVGAESPEDYGVYFAWGETTPKGVYNWDTYQYCNGSYNTMTKYCTNSSYGYNGFTDDLTTLLSEDDAATANWGNGWRMPTKEEFEELYNNTTVTWTQQNGVNGRLFTASNGSSLFLPAAGARDGGNLYTAGRGGHYCSSSLDTDNPYRAWYFYFDSGYYDMTYGGGRYYGNSVRAVRASSHVSSYTIIITPNPTVGGVVSGGGDYPEGAVCTLTATANAGYAFSNWTENGNTVSTDANYSFTVNSNRTLVANFTANGGGGGNHAYVDLGLPSGLLWATCNVGANTPEEYGDYFAWGETTPKGYYDWSTYRYCNGDYNQLTKYCNDSYYGYNGFTDNLTSLLPEDDVATVNWGSGWRMPTKEEWQELLDNTTSTWTTWNGVNGWLFTAPNGNSLFLPAAGDRWHDEFLNVGSYGLYWSSSLVTYSRPYEAWRLNFSSGGTFVSSEGSRDDGHPVRPVREN